MKTNSISVIIPTYNRAHTLTRSLNSVFSQTYLPDEIIVVNDGSTDNTLDTLKPYSNIQVIQQKNQGVSSARNAGILKAKSNWIALLDSDDEWVPTKLEQQLTLLKQHPDALWCHTEEIWIRNGVKVNQMNKHKKSGGWIFQNCLALCLISPSSVLMHRSLFQKHGLFDETLPACEDYDLWLRLTHQYPILFCDTPLTIKYGGHDDQLSQQHWGMDRFRLYAINKLLTTHQHTLSNTDKLAALDMLSHKAKLFLKGAIKHNNDEAIKFVTHLEHILPSTLPQISSSR